MIGTRSDSDGPAIAVYAAVVYDVISATNSSPQTTEINARARASTLMKWVKLGLAQAGLFMFIAFIAEPRGKKWRPVIGGGLAGALLWGQYVHAKNTGVKSCDPPTESYGPVSQGVQSGTARVRGVTSNNAAKLPNLSAL